jgi:hypothetical protein
MGSGIVFWFISIFNNGPYINNIEVINHAFLPIRKILA